MTRLPDEGAAVAAKPAAEEASAGDAAEGDAEAEAEQAAAVGYGKGFVGDAGQAGGEASAATAV